MLRVVIVLDCADERQYLRQLLSQIDDVEIVGEAENGKQAVDLISVLRPEVAFLGINIPALDGFEVAKQLLQDHTKTQIVYMASDKQCAVEAYYLDAVDFILKPYDLRRLRRSLNRIRSQLFKHKATRLYIPQKSGMVLVPIKDIVFIETDNNKRLIIHSSMSENTLVSASLVELQKALQAFPSFVRTHRAYLVNLRWVQRVETWTSSSYAIVFRNNYPERALLSRRYLSRLQKNADLVVL